MEVIPGLVVLLLGVLMIVLRNLFGHSSDIARTVLTGKQPTKSQRKTAPVLPAFMGAGLIALGFWLAVYAVLH